MKFLRQHILFFIILCWGLLTLIFGIVVFTRTPVADWYYRTIFIPVNKGWQNITSYLEVPMYYLLVGIAVILLIGQILRIGGNTLRQKLISWGLFLLSGIVLLVTLFYWMWGFNYGRTTISESFFAEDFVTVDSGFFFDRWRLQTNRVNLLRNQLMTPDPEDKLLTGFYTGLYQNKASEILPDFGLDVSLRPRCKEFKPAGTLLRLNTAGFYFPYGSESYVDRALHISQKPFVIAHELAHGYGVTDEGEANFLGYLLCQRTGDAYAQYSAALSLWLYMSADGRRIDPETAKSMWDHLNPDVWKDLEERRKLDDIYPELFPKLRDKVYDSYLNFNQVRDGMQSYNRFVSMILTYEKQRQN